MFYGHYGILPIQTENSSVQESVTILNKIRDIFCINLSAINVQFRIRADKLAITESWKKNVKNVFERVKKEGSGKLGGGFEGFEVNVGGSGSKEEEKKNFREDEEYKKIVNTLHESGFSTILPRRMLKISVESSSSINFVSIIVGGDTVQTDWSIADKEIYVDGDFSVHSNPEPKIAPYFEEGVLFSSAYIVGLQAVLHNFEDLYFFGSKATIKEDEKEAERILSDKTITGLAISALGFRGVNFASSKLLSIVKDRWINGSVKLLYDSGKKIETMEKKLVGALLFKIGEEALDISNAFAGASQWYNQSQSEINETQRDLLDENKEAQTKFDQYVEMKRKLAENREKALSDYRNKMKYIPLSFRNVMDKVLGTQDHRDTMKWAVPVSLCNPFGFFAGIGTVFTGTRLDDAVNAYHDALEQSKVYAAVKKIAQLAHGLGEMSTFCMLASTWFLTRKLEFGNWGEEKEQKGTELKEDYKEWSAEQCVDWIVDLDSNYKKYHDVLLKKLTSRKINGSKLAAKVNAALLEDLFFDVSEENAESDALLIGQHINALTQSDALAYVYVAEKFDEALAWIAKQDDEITKMLSVLNKVNTSFAFKKENVSPRKFNVIELKTFGEKISPEEEAKTLWSGDK